MGQHSLVRKNRSTRPMAIAVALGVAVSGAQVAHADVADNTVADAAAADATDTETTNDTDKNALREGVIFTSELGGKEYTKDAPRFYTLREVRELNETSKQARGYITHKINNGTIYVGTTRLETIDPNEQVVEDAPTHQYVWRSPGQYKIETDQVDEVRTELHAERGLWGSRFVAEKYSPTWNPLFADDIATTSWYEVADVTLGYAADTVVVPGATKTLPVKSFGLDNAPEGTTFELVDTFTPYDGWTVDVDEATGTLTVTLAPETKPGAVINVPVRVVYPNGTPETITATVSSAAVVNDIVKNDDGNFDFSRTGTDGVWKTIDISDIRDQITNLQATDAAQAKCHSAAALVGIPFALAVPLMALTHANVPGIAQLNTNVQKQLGIYNPAAARAWQDFGGIIPALSALAVLAGTIGGVTYAAKECKPYVKTDAMKGTELEKLSSEFEKVGQDIREKSSTTAAGQGSSAQ